MIFFETNTNKHGLVVAEDRYEEKELYDEVLDFVLKNYSGQKGNPIIGERRITLESNKLYFVNLSRLYEVRGVRPYFVYYSDCVKEILSIASHLRRISSMADKVVNDG